MTSYSNLYPLTVSIGLLLNSKAIHGWQRAIIEFILSDPLMRVCCVVIKSKQEQKHNGSFFYHLLRKIDRVVFNIRPNYLLESDMASVLVDVPTRMVALKQHNFMNEFQAEDIDWIVQQRPDVLIQFGSGILSGKIFTVVPYGIWSLQYGDGAINPGGPPGFWEVVNQSPITSVSLQILSEKPTGGLELGKAFGKTNTTSFNRNQQAIYAAGIELLSGRLRDFARLGPEKFFQTTQPKEVQVIAPTVPQNLRALQIGIIFFWRRVIQLLDKLFFIRQWVIYYHNTIADPLHFKNSTLLMADEQADWADPFLFRYNDKDYLFFEYLRHGTPNGEIRCLRMDQLSHSPVPVLVEPYHLSYPSITEFNGKLYLLVESGAGRTVGLYECQEFPGLWKKLTPMLDDIELYDPTLHFHEGLWYLMGTLRSVPGSSTDMYLHIYYADDLLSSTWTPHPLNPLTRDVRGSRPAGKIFKFNGKLIRPTQIGTPRYGFGTRFFEIVKLSPTEYIERPLEGVDDILPWQPDLMATHTYTTTGELFAVDAQIRKFRFF